MQFNSHSTNQDIVSEINFWAGSDNNNFVIADKTRGANFALDRVVSLIMRADNLWEWDDSNNTDLPVATTSLVSGQSDYSLAVTHLKILKVRIKDSAGNWISLDPVNRRDLSDSELTESSGTPRKYDKLGNSIFLYPATNYASSGGLEIQFQRGASYFITTDTTKTPGFATQFHRLFALYPAKDWCATNGLFNRVKMIENEIVKLEQELIEFYSSRDWDQKVSLSLRSEDYGQSSLQGGRSSNPNKFNT